MFGIAIIFMSKSQFKVLWIQYFWYMDQSIVCLHAQYPICTCGLFLNCKETFQFLKCDNQQVRAYFPRVQETVYPLVQNADVNKLLHYYKVWDVKLVWIFVYLFYILQSCMLQLSLISPLSPLSLNGDGTFVLCSDKMLVYLSIVLVFRQRYLFKFFF